MAENKKFLDKDGLTYFYDKIKGEYVKSSDLATVATSGSYNDLNDKPTIPTNAINNLVDGTAEGSIRSINAYDSEDGGLLGKNAQAFGEETYATGENAHAEGEWTMATGESSHAEGFNSGARGNGSHAEGNSFADGVYAHSEGSSYAAGKKSHAEGGTTAEGECSHSEGLSSTARGFYSHAEGWGSLAIGEATHAEGYETLAASNYQHVQGKFNLEDTTGDYAHIVGNGTSDSDRSNIHTLTWSGNAWYKGEVYVGDDEKRLANINEIPTKISELTNDSNFITAEYHDDTKQDVISDLSTIRSGAAAGATALQSGDNISELTNDSGYTTNTGTVTSVAVKMNGETKGTITSSGIIDLGEIGGTAINNLVDGVAAGSLRSINAYDDETNGLLGSNAVALGYQTAATGSCSHSEGAQTKASGNFSHAEGAGTTASGQYAHAEGTSGTASGQGSHTEGTGCVASGEGSHAEGRTTKASNPGAHAEGTSTTASGWNSHAEGNTSTATGSSSHAEGNESTASGDWSHAGGNHSYAGGRGAFAMGDRVNAYGAYSTVIGSRNVNDESGVDDPTKKGDYLFIAGNGSDAELSNACTLDWQGNAWFAGDIYVGSTDGFNKDDGSKKVATTDDILTYTVVSTW